MKKLQLSLGAFALLSGACAEAPTSDDFGYNGTGIAVSVAPLTLESLSDACYSFAVVNGDTPGQLVVGRGPGAAAAHNGIVGDPSDDLITGSALNTVCASQFGNGDGGDVSYVAPCDAQEANHTVTLWVDALCDSSADPANLLKTGTPNWAAASPNNSSSICQEIQPYMNPCGSTGCSLPVTCVENADTPVTFNFTIMGQADQGFFDIAVNFDDVFCSAKLDTCNTNNEKIRLMFDRTEFLLADGGCPWGTGLPYGGLTAEENLLDYTGPNPDGCDAFGQPHYMQAPGDNPFADPGPLLPNPNYGERIDTLVAAVACTAGPGADVDTYLTFTTLTIGCSDPTSTGPLTLDLSTVTQEGNLMIGPFPSAVYYGTESLANVNKVFTNVAIGIGEYSGCYLQWQVIPSNGPMDFGSPGEYNSFGYVNFEGNGLGGTECDQNGLNEGNTAVTTMYYPKTPIQPTDFNSQLPEGGETFTTWASCTNTAEAVAALQGELDDIESAAQALLAEVQASGWSTEAEAQLAGLKGRRDAAEATLGEMQHCADFETEVSDMTVQLWGISVTLFDIEQLFGT